MRSITSTDCPVTCSAEFREDGTSIHTYTTAQGETWQVVNRPVFNPEGSIPFLEERPWLVSCEHADQHRQGEDGVPEEHRRDITHTDHYRFCKARNALARKAVAARQSRVRVQ